MTEDGGRLIASSTLNVHEVRVGSRDESLEFMLLLLRLVGWVEEVSLHWKIIIEIGEGEGLYRFNKSLL